jgi:non-ribosomal peptide synthetase component F
MAYLQDLLTQSGRCLSQMPVAEPQPMTAAERHQILVEWNDTAVNYPLHLRLHDLFEAKVQLMPEAIAVIFN